MITIWILLFGCVGFLLLRQISLALKPGLRNIPGPFLAKFTDLWRAYHAREGLGRTTIPRLIKQYGNVVRIGPNMVYVNENGIWERLAGHKNNYPKSDGMKVWRTVKDGKEIASITTTQDTRYHAELKRPIASAYSNTNVLQYEPNVQETNRYFLKRLNEEFIEGSNKDRPCDIDNWVQYYAFDVVGEMTVSSRLGFLEEARDIDGMLDILNKEFDYRGVVQNIPTFEGLSRKNPIYLWLTKPTSPFAIHALKFAAKRRAELEGKEVSSDKKDSQATSSDRVDFMQRFLEAQKSHPIVTETNLNLYTITNFLAGSDTTAVTLRSIIYYTITTPGVLKKLRAEIDEKLPTPDLFPVAYKTAVDMPYLMAVIHEAQRIHPIGSIAVDRVLPPEGITLDSGLKLPGGTVVANTAWTANFEGSCYDDGVDPVREFRPERWLRREAKGETEEQFHDRLAVLKKNDISFSTGPRGCLGKWIALLEIYTIVPTLFGLLDIELAEPNKPWTVFGTFFARQKDMDVRLRWREGVDKELFIH